MSPLLMTANGAQSPMERVYESLLMHKFRLNIPHSHTTTDAHIHVFRQKRTRSKLFIYFLSLALAHTRKKEITFFFSYAHDMAKR